MRLGQGWGVVDAVAGHGDNAARLLQALDDGAFLVGEDLCLHVVDAEAARHRFRRHPMVAGEHDDTDAVVLQQAQRLGGRVLDRVGDTDGPGGGAIDGHEDDGLALAAQFLGAPGQGVRAGAEVVHEAGVAEGNGAPVHGPGDTLAGMGFEVGSF